jgi:hypothetical protein
MWCYLRAAAVIAYHMVCYVFCARNLQCVHAFTSTCYITLYNIICSWQQEALNMCLSVIGISCYALATIAPSSALSLTESCHHATGEHGCRLIRRHQCHSCADECGAVLLCIQLSLAITINVSDQTLQSNASIIFSSSVFSSW